MITRILPPEEWPRLDFARFSQTGREMDLGDVQVVVVEDNGRIVAYMSVLRITHMEDLWFDPEYRGNAGVAKRMMKAGFTAAKKWADRWVWASTESEHMSDIVSRVGGVELPVKSYVIPLGGN